MVQFGWRDGIEAGAVDGIGAVFYFGKIDIVVFCRDDVDFIKESFVISGDDGVTV